MTLNAARKDVGQIAPADRVPSGYMTVFFTMTNRLDRGLVRVKPLKLSFFQQLDVYGRPQFVAQQFWRMFRYAHIRLQLSIQYPDLGGSAKGMHLQVTAQHALLDQLKNGSKNQMPRVDLGPFYFLQL